MNNKEKVIQLLINEYNNSTFNPIQIDRNDISVLQIPEKEIIKILNTLHEDGLIIAKPRSPHKDFSLYWEITIKTECLEYFNNKKRAKTTNRRDWIRTYIPQASRITGRLKRALDFSNALVYNLLRK